VSVCYCGSARPYDECCGALHAGGKNASSAEALMRSRYSAYLLGLEPYLLATWHSSTRPESIGLADEVQSKWLGLEVRRHVVQVEDRAIVEFVARYRVAGRGHRLHEVSNFVREDGRWFYVDGAVNAT
jgi:SEC-C motif-containing protein